MFTDVDYHLKSGFKKILYSQMLVFTLFLDSREEEKMCTPIFPLLAVIIVLAVMPVFAVMSVLAELSVLAVLAVLAVFAVLA